MRRNIGFLGALGALAALVVALAVSPPLANADCFDIARPDQTGITGWYTSLALDDTEVPHIAYWDVTNDRLRFARWALFFWAYETAAENGGHSADLKFDSNGDAHVSHLLVGPDNLKYSVKSGGSWNTEIVDATADGNGTTSLALMSTGFPRIAYLNNSPNDLRYASKSVLGWSFQTVDTTGSTSSVSLEIDGGDVPHIAYYDTQNDNLRYATRNTLGVWVRQTVESTGSVGNYPSLALDASGNANISYYDATDQQMKYARKSGVLWTITVVADGVPAGENSSSLRLDAMGLPRIAYKDPTNDDLHYAWKSSGIWIRCVVDTAGDVGGFQSLQLTSSGDARISYCDYGLGDLKYANLEPTSVPAGGPARVTLAVRPSVVGASGATISFSQPAGAAAAASLDLFDVAGRRVRSFETAGAGGDARALSWDGRAEGGRALAQGVYFLRLTTPGGAAATQRVTIIR